MLYICSDNISDIDRGIFEKILEMAKIKSHEVRFVDLAHEDPEMLNKSAVVAVGTIGIRAVIKDLTASKMYTASQLVGKDVVDTENNFFVYNIPITFTDMMGAEEDKMMVWHKVSQMAEIYRDWFPFNDSIEDIVVAPPAKAEAAVAEAAVAVPEAPILRTLGEVPMDVNQVLNALFEHVNLTDPSLGKSLGKYEKFTLHTDSGDLNVYPTNRIPEKEDGFKISFKDLVTLVKLSVSVDCGTITFEKKDGDAVSD
jgi:hypothetical protein